MERARSVDDYIENHPKWRVALKKLRKILQGTELEETVKWGGPCYTIDGKNVVGIGAFSGYVGLWFHQGALLGDPDGVLINAQEDTTRALRQWRFTSAKEIDAARVRAYVREAIENQKQGRSIKPERGKPAVTPPELKAALAKKPKARKAYAALSKGKQREYAEHIASAKKAETKASRLTRILPMIESGVGLNDKYRGS